MHGETIALSQLRLVKDIATYANVDDYGVCTTHMHAIVGEISQCSYIVLDEIGKTSVSTWLGNVKL